jgi:hypothetical protein
MQQEGVNPTYLDKPPSTLIGLSEGKAVPPEAGLARPKIVGAGALGIGAWLGLGLELEFEIGRGLELRLEFKIGRGLELGLD